MIQLIMEIWEETEPKILEVAKNEQGSALKLLYEESTSCASEGMYVSRNMMHKKVMFFSIESKALYVVMMLVHLLPDTRTAVNTNRIVTFINV